MGHPDLRNLDGYSVPWVPILLIAEKWGMSPVDVLNLPHKWYRRFIALENARATYSEKIRKSNGTS